MKTKKLLLTAVAALGFAIVSMAQTLPSYVPANGLVGWWPFTGNANNASGNGNNGTVYPNTVLTTDRANNPSSAYLFNGTTQSGIQTNTPISYTVTGLSASVWFNSNIFLNVSAGHKMFISGTNNIPFQFSYNNGGIDLELYNQVGVLTVYTIPAIFTANTWHHVLFSASTNNSVKIYIDGLLSNAANAPSSFRVANNSTYIFGLSSSPSFPVPFNGKLDDIGIWNRALTQQEITALYNGANVGLNELSNVKMCSVYPNPASNKLNIQANEQVIGMPYVIYDNTGKVVGSDKLISQNTVITIENLAPGIYMLRVGNDSKQSFKVIKE
jgi:hypothetical protein